MARKTRAIVAAAAEGHVAGTTRTDLAAGAAAVLLGSGHAGKIYELGGDNAWNFNELAETIGETIGEPVTYQAVDAPALIEILQKAGLDEGTAGFVATPDRNIADGALAEANGDLSRLIGRPTTPLKKGLLDTIS